LRREKTLRQSGGLLCVLFDTAESSYKLNCAPLSEPLLISNTLDILLAMMSRIDICDANMKEAKLFLDKISKL
jgi:hypothetical protein